MGEKRQRLQIRFCLAVAHHCPEALKSLDHDVLPPYGASKRKPDGRIICLPKTLVTNTSANQSPERRWDARVPSSHWLGRLQ